MSLIENQLLRTPPGKEIQYQDEALNEGRVAAWRPIMEAVDGKDSPVQGIPTKPGSSDEHDTLKYHLLGPSLTKAGQDTVDQQKVSHLLYKAVTLACALA